MAMFNAVYILWQRQLKRYFRSKPRIIGSLGQPLLFLIALGFGLGPVFEKAGQGNYINFLVPGVIAMAILFTAVFSGIETIWDKQFGFLKETMVAPVSRFSIMLGRTLGGATVATFQGFVVLLLSLLFGFQIPGVVELGIAVVFMFMIGFLFAALGTAIAAVVDDMQAFPLIMNLLVMPLFFLSGALFPLSGAPDVLKMIASIDPLSYGVDAIRGAFLGTYHFGLAMDFGVLAVLTIIMVAIGSHLFSKIQP